MAVIIAVANQKGGVGKTTLAFNLAKILSGRGKKVLAIDNDPQGNLTASLLDRTTKLTSDIFQVYNDDPQPPMKVFRKLWLMGASKDLSSVAEKDFEVIFKLKDALEPVNADYDYIIIDCLPSLGYLMLAALNAADYLLVPVKAAPYALQGMADLEITVDKVRKRLNGDLKFLGIIMNQVDGRKPIMERELESVLRERFGDLVFKARLNRRVGVEESPTFKKSIAEHDPKGKSALEFKAFTSEVLSRIKRDKGRRGQS